MQKQFNLGLGERCRWYREGDLSSEPCAAIVTAPDKFGILTLAVFAPGGRSIYPASGVMHISDPEAKECPQNALDNGLWDFLETDARAGQRVGSAEKVKVAESAPPVPADAEAVRNKLLLCHARGMAHGVIADQLNGLFGQSGWTAQKVAKHLRSIKGQIDARAGREVIADDEPAEATA